jgi:hypothetical protein
MTAPVMSNAAIAVRSQEQHLRLPTIRTERPTVTEHHGLPCAPVFVVNLRAVFCSNRAHGVPPFLSPMFANLMLNCPSDIKVNDAIFISGFQASLHFGG